MNGMSYIANNTKEFIDTKGYVVKGEYSLSIDLDKLQSNLGKELHTDGSSKIYVSFIENTGNPNIYICSDMEKGILKVFEISGPLKVAVTHLKIS